MVELINPNEHQYLNLCQHVLENGVKKEDRTGTGTISTFGYQMRFDMRKGFPLLTTKQINYKKVLGELLAFRDGVTNAKVLGDKYGFKIWELWQKDNSGDLGPIYGKQWRAWETNTVLDHDHENNEFVTRPNYIDQLQNVIDGIKNNPNGRRHIINAWNVGELDDMALPPCHLLFQFYVAGDKLSLQLYQRSADIFLGVPFNIASYATLLHMVAHVTDLQPHEFIHTLGDAHIYLNHIEQMQTQIKRTPKEPPALKLEKGIKDIDVFWFEDFTIENYNPYSAIKGDVSI